jgi:hypothetical protein
MEFLLKKIPIFKYNPLNLSDSTRHYPLVFGQPHRIKPKFAFAIGRRDMDVRRFVSFV